MLAITTIIILNINKIQKKDKPKLFTLYSTFPKSYETFYYAIDHPYVDRMRF